ncbi:hypothetical protein L3Y34_007108 [Caenorhabditis briggsae]|uniref:SGNH domain-containing protein n=1 Tax=Caenorhabditis briggsae TaxID=6238 RepID=A0AAE9A356_CAEBR|nr:hypothetical protein L3Y34_007108 [Caenorhabditis briggsae]
MVPILFLLTRCVSPKFTLLIFSTSGVLSFFYHLLASNPEEAFKSVLARVWQFVLGMIVYLKVSERQRNQKVSEDEVALLEFMRNEEKKECYYHRAVNDNINVVLLATSAITSYSIQLNPLFARVTTTCFTALFIYCCPENEPPFHKVFHFFGDISFALYLIHWPFYAYWKMIGAGSSMILALTLVAAVFIATIAHLSFEKWSLKLGWRSVFFLVIVLAAFNFTAVYKEEIEMHFKVSTTSSESFQVFNQYLNATFTSFDQVDAQNRLWQKNDFVQLEIPGSKSWVGIHNRINLPPGGTSKFMIVGSSTAANLAPLIQDECGFKAKSIVQFTFPACEPIYPTEQSHCIKKLDEFHKAVAIEKPDYLFLGGRFLNMGNRLAANLTNLEYDQVLAVARDRLQKYMESVSQKIVLIHAFPRPSIPNLEKLAQLFREKKTPLEIDKLVIEPIENGYLIARERYDALLKGCGHRCDFIDYTTFLRDNTTNSVRYFNDIGLSYFTLGLHLSPLALELARPTMAELCKRL